MTHPHLGQAAFTRRTLQGGNDRVQRLLTLPARVLDKIDAVALNKPYGDIMPDENMCWMWRGTCSRTRGGVRRPHVWWHGRMQLVTRVLLCTMDFTPSPVSMLEGGHTCPAGENAGCVNPYHLRWMTKNENSQMRRKPRR